MSGSLIRNAVRTSLRIWSESTSERVGRMSRLSSKYEARDGILLTVLQKKKGLEGL
jgi:hypothetical protein